MTYLWLFWEFFKTGLFAIGGGLAAVPFMYDIAARYDWLSADIIPDMIAISESTPGPIGVNMATYAGYNAAGIPGAIVATLSLVLPSIFIVIIVFKFLERFRASVYVKSAFYAVRPAVAAMIAAAGWAVTRSAIFSDSFSLSGFDFLSMVNLISIVVIAVTFVLLRKFKGHPLFYILGGAVVGMIFQM